MKKYFLITSLLLLMSCGSINNSQNIIGVSHNSEPSQYPQKDKRVVAYGRGPSDSSDGVILGTIGMAGTVGIVTDMDILKKLYKTSLNEENFDSECDYFLIFVTIGEGLSYIEISKDPESDSLLIYNIHPSLSQPFTPLDWHNEWGAYCMYPASIGVLGALICDKDGGLKDKVKFPTIKYYDSTWNCWGSEERPADKRRNIHESLED